MLRGVLVVGAATLALGALPADASIERPVRLEWELVDVSNDARSVRIVFAYGGCTKPDPRPITLVESTNSIDIAVTGTTLEAEPGDEFACHADLRLRLRWIKLDRPVGGRRVTGGPEIPDNLLTPRPWRVGLGTIRGVPDMVWVVPRTVGLRAADARLLLVRQGFQVRGERSGTVTSQRPQAGAEARLHRTVTLHSAQH